LDRRSFICPEELLRSCESGLMSSDRKIKKEPEAAAAEPRSHSHSQLKPKTEVISQTVDGLIGRVNSILGKADTPLPRPKLKIPNNISLVFIGAGCGDSDLGSLLLQMQKRPKAGGTSGPAPSGLSSNMRGNQAQFIPQGEPVRLSRLEELPTNCAMMARYFNDENHEKVLDSILNASVVIVVFSSLQALHDVCSFVQSVVETSLILVQRQKNVACATQDLSPFKCLGYYKLIQDFPGFESQVDALLNGAVGLASRDIDLEKSLFADQVSVVGLSLNVFPGYFSRKNPYILALCLAYNSISSIECAEFKQNMFAELVSLDLSFNCIQSVSPLIGELKKLKKLNLSNNQIFYLPRNIGDLLQLSHLNLSHNAINHVPTEIVQLTELEHFDLTNNPLDHLCSSEIPKTELVGKSAIIKSKLFKYLNALIKGDSKKDRRIQMMLVGDAGVGKTSICSVLKTQKPVNTQEYSIATDGIDIQTFQEEKLHFECWDFAGQELYYTTHQFFLSEYAIYIVCFNLANLETLARAKYWVKSIRTRVPYAAIVVIGTHLDHPVCTPQYLDQVNTTVKNMFSKYAVEKTFHWISSTHPKASSIKNILSHVTDVAKKRKHFDFEIPIKIYMLHRKCRDLRKRKVGLIEVKQLTALMDALKIPPSEHAYSITLLQKLGSAIYHPDLDGLLILDPQFLIHVMVSIVSIKNYWASNGTVSESKMETELAKTTDNVKLRKSILNLLVKFEVIFHLPDRKYLVPCMLSRLDLNFDNFSNCLFQLEPENVNRRYYRVYSFSSHPFGFFPRVMVKILGLEGVTALSFSQNFFVVRDAVKPQQSTLVYDPQNDELSVLSVSFKPPAQAHGGAFSTTHRITLSNVPQNKKKKGIHLAVRIIHAIDEVISAFYVREKSSSKITIPYRLSPDSEHSESEETKKKSSHTQMMFSESPCRSNSAPSKLPVRKDSSEGSNLDQFNSRWETESEIGILSTSPSQSLLSVGGLDVKDISERTGVDLKHRYEMKTGLADFDKSELLDLVLSLCFDHHIDPEKYIQDQILQKKLKTAENHDTSGCDTLSHSLSSVTRRLSFKSRTRIAPIFRSSHETVAADPSESLSCLKKSDSEILVDVPTSPKESSKFDEISASFKNLKKTTGEAPPFAFIGSAAAREPVSPRSSEKRPLTMAPARVPPVPAVPIPAKNTMVSDPLLFACFTYEEVIAAVVASKPIVLPSGQTITINQLAPDIALFEKLGLSGVDITGPLGKGCFGVISSGTWSNQPVAIKQLSNPTPDVATWHDFMHEVYVMLQFDHPNLVGIHGTSLNPFAIVLELCLTSLDKVIYDPKVPDTTLTVLLQTRIAKDIAQGLLALHKTKPTIIHRDVRSPNIFISSLNPADPVLAKLGDFGLAQAGIPFLTELLASWQWLPPEAIDGTGPRYDHRLDIYSYGMTLFELCSRKLPFTEFEEFVDREAKKLSPDQIINPEFIAKLTEQGWEIKGDMTAVKETFKTQTIKTKIIAENLRPVIPTNTPKHLKEIIQGCWQKDPTNRLELNKVIATLNDTLKTLQ